MIPMGGNVVRPNPKIVDNLPGLLFEYGFDGRKSGQKYEITREQADEFSLESRISERLKR
jgi:acetyl-CoA acyltransferase